MSRVAKAGLIGYLNLMVSHGCPAPTEACVAPWQQEIHNKARQLALSVRLALNAWILLIKKCQGL